MLKKNGTPRPAFRYWISEAARQGMPIVAGGTIAVTSETTQLSAVEIVLRELQPLDKAAELWRRHDTPRDLIGAEELARHLGGKNFNRLVLSISHDNYRTNAGGVQFCIQREEVIAAAQGVDYLQVHPWQPLPQLAPLAHGEDLVVNLILRGHEIGSCTMRTLRAALLMRRREGTEIEVVIHHLLGHSPEEIAELIAESARGDRCLFWLHDFFSLCVNYVLQRNNVTFCDAPPSSSNACALCAYGEERHRHLIRIASFFANVKVEVVAPSQVTADYWQSKSSLPIQSLTIVPHLELDVRPVDLDGSSREPNVITVAHLGAPVRHKGWQVFSELMHANRQSDQYRFLVFSSREPSLGEDKWIPVTVTAEDPNSMSNAIERENVDVVINWSTWPETFSFTTHEAFSGGAFVVTNAGSGNVAAAVEASKRGVVLNDKADLIAFFADGRAQELTAKRRHEVRRAHIQHRLSNMSFALLAAA